jgi:hypothetical protein
VDDTTQTIADAPEESTLTAFAVDRSRATARIAVVIVTDAALFLIWIGVAWVAQYVAQLARNNGVNEFFAIAFMWISSATTLLLTLFYIASDIAKEYRRLFHAKRNPSIEERPS